MKEYSQVIKPYSQVIKVFTSFYRNNVLQVLAQINIYKCESDTSLGLKLGLKIIFFLFVFLLHVYATPGFNALDFKSFFCSLNEQGTVQKN